MPKLKQLFFLTLMLIPVTMMGQVSMSMREKSIAQWLNANLESRRALPFTFKIAGVPSASVSRNWKYISHPAQGITAGEKKRVYTYLDAKSNLKIDCTVRYFSAYDAAIWTVRITNTGSNNSPAISAFKALDMQVSNGKSKDKGYTLRYARGSNAGKDDFAPQIKAFAQGTQLTLVPHGGRSSDGVLPFFNVDFGTSGIIEAIGWTGTWRADFGCNASGAALSSGQNELDAWLKPGESIRSTSVCLMRWHGEDFLDGQNKWRQFVLNAITAKVDGKLARYPSCTGFNYSDPAPCNEYSCMDADYAKGLVRRYNRFQLVQDALWLDAGWYGESADYEHGHNWYNSAGTWLPDSVRFPDGLKPISDVIHKVGLKFMVWFEPERVMRNSLWGRTLPKSWLLDANPQFDQCLLNLADTGAVSFLSDYMCRFLAENGIDYYRQDFNVEPAGFWASKDEPGRKGITENKYIEGLYRYWDNILTRRPGTLIDNCASGGRRLDLETLQRSAPLWRTDYNYGEPLGYQSHTFGLAMWIPQSGTCVTQTDKFSYRSSFGTCVVFNWKVTTPGMNLLEMRDIMNVFREVRPYFYEDYYPLTSLTNSVPDNIWLAYQLNRKSRNDGIIVAFRRDACPDSTCVVKLRGLKPNGTYSLYNYDTNSSEKVKGDAMMKGLKLVLNTPRSSLLLKYKEEN